MSPVDEGILAATIFVLMTGAIGTTNLTKSSIVPGLTWQQMFLYTYIVSALLVNGTWLDQQFN